MPENTLTWRTGYRENGSVEAAIIAVDSISGPFTALGGFGSAEDEVVQSFTEFLNQTPLNPDEQGAYDLGAAGVADLQRSVPVTKQLENFEANSARPDAIPDRTVTFHYVGESLHGQFTRMIPVNVEALKQNTERYIARQKQAEERPPAPSTVTTTTKVEKAEPKEEVKKPSGVLNPPTSPEPENFGSRKSR